MVAALLRADALWEPPHLATYIKGNPQTNWLTSGKLFAVRAGSIAPQL